MTSIAASLPYRSDQSFFTEWRRTVDWPLLLAGVGLILAGLLLSLAAGPAAASRIGYNDSFHFVERHLVFAGLGTSILVIGSFFRQDWVRRFAALAFLGSIVLMIAILLVGHEVKGAQRWLRIAGISIQPSEFVKPALIVLTGWLLAQRNLFPKGPWALITLGLFILVLSFLLLQPDIGQSALLSAGFAITFFVAGTPWICIAVFSIGGGVFAVLLYFSFDHVQRRVNAFFDPSGYDTYQIDKASEAISRGGLLGVGPGEGTVKGSLPDAHTDFIFAVLSEEFGLLAAVFLIAVFVYIVLRGIWLASRIEESYPRAAATGLFAIFGLQAAINLAVNVSLIPPKGMTLPLISYGGSSMVGIAMTLGFAMALIRGRINRSYEDDYYD